MATDVRQTGTDAPPDDLPKNELEFVRQWLEAIDLSTKEEDDWLKTADRACDTYRGGPPKSGSSQLHTNLNTFNIFHANVETLVPALYNSTPIPDVRRRFNDDDPVGKEVSEIFERALSYQVDAYDFDQILLSSVRDMAITSRGVVEVQYEPSFGEDGNVAYERATCHYVPWRTFRRGPGRTWEEVPWIAFEVYLSYSEVERLLEDEKDKARILKEMRFSYSAEPKKQAEQQGENLSKLAARAHIWKIWDKDNRKVHFISPDYASRRLTSIDDPLGLTDFFPIPRPLAAIVAPDSLVPITLLQIYERLLEELNVVQRRIMRLTEQLRPRGIYAGLQADIKQVTEADDGELIAATSAEIFATTGGGLDKAISWFPLEATTMALKQLVEQRELIKQTIYEVTGLSDIIRGASDARETATAQQLKSQWGSLRIQRMQAEVARFARDLFRIKAEVMANKFDFKTFELMTGLKYPTQQEQQQAQQLLQQGQQMLQGQQPPPELQKEAKRLQEILSKPSREQIEQTLRNDAVRGFRVDIESDSTIRGDVQRNQEQMSLFLQGTAQYMSAVGPLVQEGAMPQDLAIEIFAGFARSFRLGKQAEDSLDKLADQAKAQAGQPKPPSPEELKLKLEEQRLELDKQKMAMELEFKKAEMALEQQTAQSEMVLEQQKAEHEAKLKEMELQHDMQLQQAEMEQKTALAREEHQQKLQLKQTETVANLEQQAQKHASEHEMMMQNHHMEMGHKREMADHEMKTKQMAFKMDQARKDKMAEAESKAKIDHETSLREKEYSERQAERAKPRKSVAKVIRDDEGRMMGAEVTH